MSRAQFTLAARGRKTLKFGEIDKMAWTWSAPQRGTLASTLAIVEGQRRIARAAVILGKGDYVRGQFIAIAAWLGIIGAAAQTVPPAAITGLLCATAALVLFTAFSSSEDFEDDYAANGRATSQPEPATPAAPLHLKELLTANPETATDRAAFAKLTAHMSHELRTPLNAILGFSELMSNEVFGPLGSTSYAGYARDIHMSGLSLLKSADDALAITALLTGPNKARRSIATDAAAAAQEALRFHATSFAARGLKACCTIEANSNILCDMQTVRQLLINLIDDAATRAAPDATLTLAARNVGAEFEIQITVSELSETQPAGENFSMLLARTLAELCGARLDTTFCAGDCQITARFLRATQHELF